VFVRHFKEYADSVLDFNLRGRTGLAIDIGSNDGTFLRFLKDAGYDVLGIDPARDIAASASAQGIETLPTFFSAELGRHLRQERGGALLVTANNVFAHIDDLDDVADGVRSMLLDDGLFVFEASYFVDVYEQTLFDTIYHEHLAYHTVGPLDRFLAAHDLDLVRVDRVASHGGSIRCYAQPAGGPLARDASVDHLIALEAQIGLNRAETLRGFAARIDHVRDELLQVIKTIRDRGERIAAFGAPAKATTLMYHFGLGPDVVEFIVDDSPLKQGLYSPGLHIPVLPSDALYEQRPDYAIILAWNFAEPIMRNHARFLEDGGHFIVPLPAPEIH
jgi:SAM-dependent methyltransferase